MHKVRVMLTLLPLAVMAGCSAPEPANDWISYGGDVGGLRETRQLFMRPLNSLASRPIPGTNR